MTQKQSTHFIGIGGSGMSALAQLFAGEENVSGSDRSWPAQDPTGLFAKLAKQGIRLFPQNGEGITSATTRVVLSTAIEKDNADLAKATALGKQQIHRSDLLAQCANASQGIAVSGTSGKSTICGMVGVLFEERGLSPTVVNGGEVVNFLSDKHLGNSKKGIGKHFVIEADESDGTLTKYFPRVGIVSNISKDHKTPEELEKLFLQFARQTEEMLIWNADCPATAKINWPAKKQLTYGIEKKGDVRASSIDLNLEGSQFSVGKVRFTLRVPGVQNVSNALAAIAAGLAAGIPIEKMPPGLEAFRGIRRRLDLIFRRGKFSVFDDFAHNPDKIRASLRTLIPFCRRLVAVFQPHGYAPTRFLFDDYVRTFNQELRPEDRLFLLPIFDAGGTADRSISSADLAGALVKENSPACAVSSREELLKMLKSELNSQDTVLVMGARDNSLTPLCHSISKLLS